MNGVSLGTDVPTDAGTAYVLGTVAWMVGWACVIVTAARLWAADDVL